ncbi:MAG: hypothetical protein AB1921_04570 [Thermodesulfobacteriota bacterium]
MREYEQYERKDQPWVEKASSSRVVFSLFFNASPKADFSWRGSSLLPQGFFPALLSQKIVVFQNVITGYDSRTGNMCTIASPCLGINFSYFSTKSTLIPKAPFHPIHRQV